MLLNWCCSMNIFNIEKSVGGDVKKSITLSFFNRITCHSAVRCKTSQKINVESLKLKFQTVAEKTAKNVRGLLYFAAPGNCWTVTKLGKPVTERNVSKHATVCMEKLTETDRLKYLRKKSPGYIQEDFLETRQTLIKAVRLAANRSSGRFATQQFHCQHVSTLSTKSSLPRYKVKLTRKPS